MAATLNYNPNRVVAQLQAKGERMLAKTSKSILRFSINSMTFSSGRPGAPPQVVSGELQRSGGTRKAGPLKFEVFFTAPHAEEVEMGTQNMPPHPFLAPAFIAHEAQFARDLSQLFS